jgi:hypothetical protein
MNLSYYVILKEVGSDRYLCDDWRSPLVPSPDLATRFKSPKDAFDWLGSQDNLDGWQDWDFQVITCVHLSRRK